MLRKGKFSIDGDTEENTIVDGWTDESTWNGWDNIWLDESQLVEWLDSSPYDYRKLANGSILVYFEEEQTFTPDEVDGMTLYCMNGYCFVELEG